MLVTELFIMNTILLLVVLAFLAVLVMFLYRSNAS